MRPHQNRLKLIFDMLLSSKSLICCQSKAPKQFILNIYRQFGWHLHKSSGHQQKVSIKPLEPLHLHSPRSSRNVEWWNCLSLKIFFFFKHKSFFPDFVDNISHFMEDLLVEERREFFHQAKKLLLVLETTNKLMSLLNF